MLNVIALRLAVVVFVVGACGDRRENARQQLTKKGIEQR